MVQTDAITAFINNQNEAVVADRCIDIKRNWVEVEIILRQELSLLIKFFPVFILLLCNN